MQTTTRTIKKHKTIALVAHDHYKNSLLEWCKKHKAELQKHNLFATGTTGKLIEENVGINTTALLSGPMGGDQQIGAYIAEQKIDLMIFFWDPLNSVPHDPDVKALLRIATVWNLPIATNKSTADILLTSTFMHSEFVLEIPDYDSYIKKRTT